MPSRNLIARKFGRRRFGAVEVLEDRAVPALFVVNSFLDLPFDPTDTIVTLRDALTAANTNVAVSPTGPTGDVDDDVIVFDSAIFGGAGNIIALTLGELQGTRPADRVIDR